MKATHVCAECARKNGHNVDPNRGTTGPCGDCGVFSYLLEVEPVVAVRAAVVNGVRRALDDEI